MILTLILPPLKSRGIVSIINTLLMCSNNNKRSYFINFKFWGKQHYMKLRLSIQKSILSFKLCHFTSTNKREKIERIDKGRERILLHLRAHPTSKSLVKFNWKVKMVNCHERLYACPIYSLAQNKFFRNYFNFK